MAKISAKMPVIADITSGGVFDDGAAVGRLIQVTATPNLNKTTLYADDTLAESAEEKTETLAINTDTVPLSLCGRLFGATYTTGGSGTPPTVVFKSDDVSPFVGFGFIAGEINSGVNSYKVIVYNKVQFDLPTNEYTTKGESITFNTPTINATAYPDEYGVIKTEYQYDDATDAVNKLKTLFDIA